MNSQTPNALSSRDTVEQTAATAFLPSKNMGEQCGLMLDGVVNCVCLAAPVFVPVCEYH